MHYPPAPATARSAASLSRSVASLDHPSQPDLHHRTHPLPDLPSRDGQRRLAALRFPASRGWGGIVMSGPGDETASAESRGRGGLRTSHADREQVIGTLKVAYVQGRLTEDELDARVDQVLRLADVLGAGRGDRRHPCRAHQSPASARPVAGDEGGLGGCIRTDPARPHYACCSPRRTCSYHRQGGGHLVHDRLCRFLDSRRVRDGRLSSREALRRTTAPAVGTRCRRVTGGTSDHRAGGRDSSRRRRRWPPAGMPRRPRAPRAGDPHP